MREAARQPFGELPATSGKIAVFAHEIPRGFNASFK
jgi:hypothetical protein